MTVEEFEEKVWDVEGIRLVVRAGANASVDEYNYQKAC